MSDGTGWQFKPEDLTFFGQRTASVSHELKNVMSIINESAGLLGDLAAGAASGRPMDPKRVAKTATNIGRNVQRGVEIIDRLNRFSHSVDEPVRGLDLTALLDDVVQLTHRFAGLHGASIEATMPSEPLPVQSYVFGLHQVLTEAIRLAVVSMESYDPVTVALQAVDGGAVVTVVRAPVTKQGEFDERMARVEILAAELGCTVQVAAGAEGRQGVALAIPGRVPGRGAGG